MVGSHELEIQAVRLFECFDHILSWYGRQAVMGVRGKQIDPQIAPINADFLTSFPISRLGTQVSRKLCFPALETNARRKYSPHFAKQSFADKCVPKLEFGNENLLRNSF